MELDGSSFLLQVVCTKHGEVEAVTLSDDKGVCSFDWEGGEGVEGAVGWVY